MKHPLPTTITLLALFLATQLLGLTLVNMVMPVTQTASGETIVSAPDTAIGPPPETTPGGALLMLLIGITLGTILILVLVRFRRFGLWRVWFLLAAGLTMTISFGVILGSSRYTFAAMLGFALAAVKVFKPNPYVHNLTELFIYPGMAVLFYHILSVPVMLLLLALISIYDIIAVFRSKHMVSMALFQTESKVFAGLAIPRGKPLVAVPASKPLASKNVANNSVKRAGKALVSGGGTAVLGGGDIAFPLLFASVVMKELVMGGVVKATALGLASIIAVGATASLTLLFAASQKGKFYPAMPAVSAGAIIGWLVVLVLA